MKLWQLDELIKTVCPIEGINSDGDVWFAPDATDAEKQAAYSLMQQHLPRLELLPAP